MAEAIPREVLSEHLQERLAGKQVLGAVFLTFQYDPGFFEQEILPVILDVPVSHAQVARWLQLEGALREVPFGVAVFYDWAGLCMSEYPAPRLDVRRFPVRVPTGIFHPKIILLLTEDRDPDGQGAPTRRLMVAALSANLTRTGWWENVEACHVEELEEGQKTTLRDPLLDLLHRVSRLTHNRSARRVLRPYRQFLNGLKQRRARSRHGRLEPHLYVGGGGAGENVAEFLKRRLPRDATYRLEIISPFFDGAPGSGSPLASLIDALNPQEVRVYLPQDDTGEARCSEAFFSHVESFGDRVAWGTLPRDVVEVSRNADAGRRSVHAKVYRIFKPRPRTEYIFVGSVNLTTAAHSGSGGNLETGFLVEVEPVSRPDFWLRPLEQRPQAWTRADAGEDEHEPDPILPLQLRFSWRSGEASGRWDGESDSPPITFAAPSGPFGAPIVFRRRTWQLLGSDVAERLAEELKSTSIVTARSEDGRECRVLVQEDDMLHKPELLRVVPVRDILEYWALLRPEQRQAFLESRGALLSPEEVSSLVPLADDVRGIRNDMFARCAGVFHAFAQLEARVLEALDRGLEHQAAVLMFGERFDSLPTVIDRVSRATDEDAEELSVVDRYLILMCAVQLCERVRERSPRFWQQYADRATVVSEKLNARQALREQLCSSEPEELSRFMDWFDRWFLERAESAGHV